MLVPFFRTLKHIFPYFISPNNECRSDLGATAQHSVSAPHFPPFHSTNNSLSVHCHSINQSSIKSKVSLKSQTTASQCFTSQHLCKHQPLGTLTRGPRVDFSHFAFIILSDSWRSVPHFSTLVSMYCKWYGAFSATPLRSTINSPFV